MVAPVSSWQTTLPRGKVGICPADDESGYSRSKWDGEPKLERANICRELVDRNGTVCLLGRSQRTT